MTYDVALLQRRVAELMREGVLFGAATLRARREQREAWLRSLAAKGLKLCPTCDRVFGKPANCSAAAWVTARYCSVSCSANSPIARGAA